MDKMKKVMSTCPVLALLDFSLPFTLECDASGGRNRGRTDAEETPS
jgi:hypothetical protein